MPSKKIEQTAPTNPKGDSPPATAQPKGDVTHIKQDDPIEYFDEEPTESIKAQIYFEREIQLINLRERAANFVFFAFGGLLFCTITLIFLQGFKFRGFNLEVEFLSWLGAATVGEVGTILAMVFGFLFKKG